MPSISVVVPAYNVEDYLAECLDSLVNQTLRDIEVIVVDDCSTDRTAEIASRYADADERIHLVRNASNKGLFANRHVGVVRATGDYVTFLDADDAFELQACQVLHAELEAQPVDILHFGVRVVAESDVSQAVIDGTEAAKNPPNLSLTGEQILQACFIDKQFDFNTCHKVYKTSLAQSVMARLGTDAYLSAAEDVVEVFALTMEANTYRGISNAPLYLYHVGRGQTGSQVFLAAFKKSSQLKKDCYEFLRVYVEGQLSTQVRAQALECVRNHMIEHSMNEWQDSVALSDRTAALEAISALWPAQDLLVHAYRFLRDDAYALLVAVREGNAAPDARERYYANRESIDSVFAQFDYRNASADLKAMKAVADDHACEFSVIAMLRNTPKAEWAARYAEMATRWEPTLLVSKLFAQVWSVSQFDMLSALEACPALHVTRSSCKTVAAYYYRSGVGGAERVTLDLCALWLDMGLNVVFFTDEEVPAGLVSERVHVVKLPPFLEVTPDSYVARATALQNALVEYEVDALVYSQWLSHVLQWDMLVAKQLGVAFVVHTHGPYLLLPRYNSEDAYALPLAYRMADAVVCLSALDATFWRYSNTNVYQTSNPARFSCAQEGVSPLDSKSIVWVGRLSEAEKQPGQALEVLKRVTHSVPDAQLYMVGGGEPDVMEKLKKRASDLGIFDRVHFEGERYDVEVYYRKAAVLLMTSPSEGNPLVIAESKVFGVPAVMYDLPCVSFVEEACGLIAVPINDVDAAAKAVVQLLQNDDLRLEYGRRARESAEQAEAFDRQAFWKQVLDTALSPESKMSLSAEERKVWNLMWEESFKAIRASHESARKMQERLDDLAGSISLKAGKAMTWLPRKGVNALRKLRDKK